MSSDLDRRQDKMEDAIEKLTAVSGDLNRIVAVHEQRITQQEKELSFLYKSIENRRNDIDNKVNDIYSSIESVDTRLNGQQTELNTKISQIEKYIWMAIGGGITISWILSYFFKVLK
mgnify:FL=1